MKTSLLEMVVVLASRLDVGGSVLFIAMAETATGLGQGIFEAYLNRRCANDALFLHTTRYRVPGREFVGFEETHCHAPQHNLYLPADRVHRHLFRNAQELVLVDDEISTGSTFCNLVEAYRRYNPGLKRVHFVAITDFSGADGAVCFSARLAVPVTCVAALSGAFAFAPGSVEPCETAPSAVGDQRCAPGFVAEGLGRFGVDGPLAVASGDIRGCVAGLASGARVLVLGTAEFMHTAFRIGLELEAQGFETLVQATTRSPLLVGAGVERRLVFGDNYGEGIRNYLYNVNPESYARVIVCHETPLGDGLSELAEQLGNAVLVRISATRGDAGLVSVNHN